MKKHPILIFIAALGILIGSAIVYIQSQHFALQVKKAVSKYVPKNLGITADFSNLSIQVFPPGVGVVSPQIRAAEKNAANLAPGTEIEAARMELTFRPLQILSGRVSIHEVRIIQGKLKTDLLPSREEPKKKKKSFSLSWEDLFQVQAEGVVLEDTWVELGLPTLKSRAKFNAKKVQLEKVLGKGGNRYEALVHLGEFEADAPSSFPFPRTLDSLRVAAKIDETGIEFRQFELVREGTQAIASGTVRGDLLRARGLVADLELKLQGDLELMLRFLTAKSKEVELPSGHLAFEGQAKMELDRIPETLSAKGTLKASRVAYRGNRYDLVETVGSYSAPKTSDGHGNVLTVERAVIETEKIEKKGGFQPGLGGRVELGAFTTQLDKPGPIETTLKLTDAHVHWLGAELLEDLYALDGRISGETKIRFEPPKEKQSFQIRAEMKWDVNGLQIDNQRLSQNKKLNRIFHLKNVKLEGAVSIDSTRVHFEDGLQATMAQSQVSVSGDIRLDTPKTTYEIVGGGPVDFSDFGQLIDTPISGKGALSVRVHGPADRVILDFDTSMKDFKYLNLQFGDFRGRISWEDAPSHLVFHNLDCNQGRTRYRLGGKMDLAQDETMDLVATVDPGGQIGDFLSIFKNFTDDFWWFPQGVTGPFAGKFRIYGGIALEEMLVDAEITGERWEYWGERFRNVRLEGGYDRGKYYLSSFDLKKKVGRIFGSVSFDAKSNYDWKLGTEGLGLSDFDFIASLDIPLRGNLSGSSKGKGPQGSVESKSEIRLTNLALRGKKFEDSYLQVQTRLGKATAEGQGLGGQAGLKLYYDFTPGKESSLEVDFKRADFTPMVLLLNPALLQDEQLVALASGRFSLDFLSGQAELGSGKAQLQEYVLSKKGTRFTLDRPVDIPIHQGSFTISNLKLNGDEGSSTLSLTSRSGNIEGALRGSMDLSIAEFFTSSIQKSDGVAKFDLDISGNLKKPSISGGGNVYRGMVKIDGIESPVENISGSFQLDDDQLALEGFESDLASGRATLEGSLDFFITRWPTLDLKMWLYGNKLKVYPFQVAKVKGRVDVKGEGRPYRVSGKVLVENAISREKIASARGPGLRTVQYMPPSSSLRGGVAPSLFDLDLSVSAPGNVIVQNELMDLEAKGDLRIVGTIEQPRPLGTASAVQGKVLFKDRAFQIVSGIIEFDSPTQINPRYEVLANTELNNYKIQLFSAGRFDQQRFEFTSNPPMAESEILNLLALGVTSEDARRFNMGDRSAYEQGQAASLVLHSLDFNREVQNKTGFQIGVDEAVDERTGTSAFSRPSALDTGSSPRIRIRRQLGKRIGVSAASTVGVGTSIQREVNAEVSVTKGLSVIGVWDSVEGNTTEDPRRNSFGIDLKVQKRFK